MPAPDFVWANDGDYGYGLFLPDAKSAAWFEANVGRIQDPFLRAMAWGALWDLVRNLALSPHRYVQRVLDELPREQDETLAGTVLGRALYALERYVPDAEAAPLVERLEPLLLARADDRALSYGLRKAALDAYLGSARSPRARGILKDYLAGRRRFEGKPIGQPTRWAAVRQLLLLADPAADSLFAREQRRDSTPEGPRMAFISGAARADSASKARTFERFLADETLNEEWVTASLGAFNESLHAPLTRPYLRPALEQSEWIRRHRRIFFLPSWIDAFVGGHASPEALAAVDAFLAQNPDLPLDIRRRVLQARDELERAVRIRAAGAAG
ncbi:MAG: ERAP1-like C-terminal domain-containing protein [Gemmatimonadetes bacterium]|nr:ERAP1-like C-terminal domain-containing protein [Gemmatimonadota bacterium]